MFGSTFIILTLFFVSIMLITLVLVVLMNRVKFSDKTKDRIRRLQSKMFYNPVIRYLMLNALKLNMASLLVLSVMSNDTAELIFSGLMLLAMNIFPLVFLKILLNNHDKLTEESQ